MSLVSLSRSDLIRQCRPFGHFPFPIHFSSAMCNRGTAAAKPALRATRPAGPNVLRCHCWLRQVPLLPEPVVGSVWSHHLPTVANSILTWFHPSPVSHPMSPVHYHPSWDSLLRVIAIIALLMIGNYKGASRKCRGCEKWMMSMNQHAIEPRDILTSVRTAFDPTKSRQDANDRE